MTQTDDEKELVLGNKQLISLFFVIVALCGVFFAMGYMIGRNTSKSAATNLDGNTAPVASVPPAQSQTPEPPRETSPEETPPPEAFPERGTVSPKVRFGYSLRGPRFMRC